MLFPFQSVFSYIIMHSITCFKVCFLSTFKIVWTLVKYISMSVNVVYVYIRNYVKKLRTGASSGIGLACAKAFATHGSFLALTGRNQDALKISKEKCCEIGVPPDKVFVCTGDVTKDSECENIIKEVVNFFGKLDVLVNGAGIIINGSTEKITLDELDLQMNINTRSPFLMSKLCLPFLLQTKGNIVNISSVTGLRAFPGVVAYNMSKAALDQLTRTLALEVADRGVRVNAVNPGVIVTEVHKRAGMSDDQYKKFLEHSKTTHVMGRVGEAHEVANAVVFLASDQASFITGATLPVDGGRSIMCPR